MKYLTTLLITIFMSSFAFAQQNADSTAANSNSMMKHSLGATAAIANGIGLTYRYWPGKFGVQATFGPYYEEDNTQISSGITFLYLIAETEHVELFAYQGNHFRYNEETRDFYDPTQVITTERTDVEREFHTGVGLGVEFIILKQLNLDLMLGYTAKNNFQELIVTGGVGLYYNF
jgi:hypothetical protein